MMDPEETGNGGNMGKTLRVIRVALILAAVVGVSGCVSGKVLTLPGDLERPGKKGAAKGTEGSPAVAVLDFTFAGGRSFEVGRGLRQVRCVASRGWGWGGNTRAGCRSPVAPNYSTTRPLFVAPGGVRDALNGAAN